MPATVKASSALTVCAMPKAAQQNRADAASKTMFLRNLDCGLSGISANRAWVRPHSIVSRLELFTELPPATAIKTTFRVDVTPFRRTLCAG